MTTAAIRRHWSRVVALGCAVHGSSCTQVEIAHCAGKPSVVERIREPKAKGVKLARMDWLVIPLCAELHRLSCYSLDYAPAEWEATHGSVAGMIDRVAAALGIDVWALSQVGRK